MKIFLQPNEFIKDAVKTKFLEELGDALEFTSVAADADLQWADYEDLDFQAALKDSSKWICAYSIRKALIRKHFLVSTVKEYVAKNPQSILKSSVPESWSLEVDYVEFLDDALDEAFELRGELEENESRSKDTKKWFLLKPGMTDRGAGLRLFSNIDELTQIFQENEPAELDSDAEEEEVNNKQNQGVMTSDMRFFVVQEYVRRPLLLDTLGQRKFHIRAYVLCIGSLQVYLHRNLLVLGSSRRFEEPCFDVEELDRHLTNTCYQVNQNNANTGTSLVYDFWSIIDRNLNHALIWQTLQAITHDLFDAASAQRVHFQTLPNAFELFGLDFLVDAAGVPHLLEVNAYPDLAQTGPALKDLVEEVSRDTVVLVINELHKPKNTPPETTTQLTGFEKCFSSVLLC